MNVLLDTHVWIWSQEAPDALGARARSLLVDAENTVFVSTISSLEIARLSALGRVRLRMDLGSWIARSIEFLVAETLALSHRVAVEAYSLPAPFHRDPADRILAATARVHGLSLMTADDRLLGYPGVASLDARV